jgi:hypothetical protein
MRKYLAILILILLAVNILAQKDSTKESNNKLKKESTITLDLAKSALEAHGGDKFKQMKTLSIIGSVDVTVSSFTQPASFVTVFSGDKYRLEIDTPQIKFKQIFDGSQTFTSPQQGFSLPPINLLGLPLLQRLGDTGFEVSALSDTKKTGFRITSPEGYYTDFYLDKKTSKIKAYDSSYIINNREATTSVEIDKFEDKDGIIIPSKYAQRFDFGQMTVYAEFKAKEIMINTKVDDNVFAL